MRRHVARNSSGQATVEYLLVGLVLIVVAAGLAAVWRYSAGSGFSEQATTSASHTVESVEGVADALAY